MWPARASRETAGAWVVARPPQIGAAEAWVGNPVQWVLPRAPLDQARLRGGLGEPHTIPDHGGREKDRGMRRPIDAITARRPERP